jgi:hypothetical protein
VADAEEPSLAPGYGFYLDASGQWVVKEIPEEVLKEAKHSGYLKIQGYKCTVFETPSKEQWAQKSTGIMASTMQIASRIAGEDDNWLFHVTYYKDLPSVESVGLLPTAGGALGQGGYAGHSHGRLFMAEEGGVPFWYERMEQHAEANSDNPYEDGYTPIVMRFIAPEHLQEDIPGTDDSRAGSYFIEAEVPPDGMEVWNGNAWIPLYKWDTIDPVIAYDIDYYDDDDEGESVEAYIFKSSNPLSNPD